MSYITVLNQTAVLFIPIIIGILVKKLKMVDGHFGKSLSSVLFNVSLPCSILCAMQFEFQKSLLIESGLLVLLGFGILGVSLLIGFLLSQWMGREDGVKNVIRFSITFSNFSFMGYPIVQMLYGQKGLFYASVFTIPFFLLVNSLGILILEHKKGERAKVTFEKILNMPTLALLVGFILFVLSIRLPDILNSAANMFAQTTTPMSMILSGLVLADSKLLSIFKNYRLYVISAFRLLLIPILVFVLLRLFGLSGLLLNVPVIICAMPVASNIVLLSQKFAGDVQFSAETVLFTTFFSIVTIPLIQLILM